MAVMAAAASLAVPLGAARSLRPTCRAAVASSRPRQVTWSRFRDTRTRGTILWKTTLSTFTGSPRRRARRTTAFAFSDDDSGTPTGRWRGFCDRLEKRVERSFAKRIINWVGDNPVVTVVGTLAISLTAGAVASALAMQLAFSALSILLPVVFFATVGVPFMLLFGGALVFGVLLPFSSIALFAVGGSLITTMSTILPIILFVGAIALGSNLVDVLLPGEETGGEGEGQFVKEKRTQRKEMNKSTESSSTNRDPDLTRFDMQLLGDPSTWTSVDVDRWIVAEGLGEWRDAFAAQGVDGPQLVKLKTEDLKRMGVADESSRGKILGALRRMTGR